MTGIHANAIDDTSKFSGYGVVERQRLTPQDITANAIKIW